MNYDSLQGDVNTDVGNFMTSSGDLKVISRPHRSQVSGEKDPANG